MIVRGEEIDYVDDDGFNDFTVAGVFFSHYPGRATLPDLVYKVRWPDLPGAGRLYFTAVAGWAGHCLGAGADGSFYGVTSKVEAVERMVDRRWDDPKCFPTPEPP